MPRMSSKPRSGVLQKCISIFHSSALLILHYIKISPGFFFVILHHFSPYFLSCWEFPLISKFNSLVMNQSPSMDKQRCLELDNRIVERKWEQVLNEVVATYG